MIKVLIQIIFIQFIININIKFVFISRVILKDLHTLLNNILIQLNINYVINNNIIIK